MSLNNECTCKRVLVFPRVEERVSAIIMAQTPISSPNLENYYDKKETDDLLNEKLSTNDLDNAIDQALLEAKESGDFKGDKGDKGDRGEQGIQGEKGEQGENGEDGYTPVKGTDYFTDADKQEFITELTPTIENLINQAIGEIEYGTY